MVNDAQKSAEELRMDLKLQHPSSLFLYSFATSSIVFLFRESLQNVVSDFGQKKDLLTSEKRQGISGFLKIFFQMYK